MERSVMVSNTGGDSRRTWPAARNTESVGTRKVGADERKRIGWVLEHSKVPTVRGRRRRCTWALSKPAAHRARPVLHRDNASGADVFHRVSGL